MIISVFQVFLTASQDDVLYSISVFAGQMCWHHSLAPMVGRWQDGHTDYSVTS
jgi:hypothetical protein